MPTWVGRGRRQFPARPPRGTALLSAVVAIRAGHYAHACSQY
jgi:hypothetical protein